MSDQAFAVEPIWDQMIAERGGRGPAEFEGHETWDDSDEAKEAEARGRAEAEATSADFLGWDPTGPRVWPTDREPDDYSDHPEYPDELDTQVIAERITDGDDEL